MRFRTVVLHLTHAGTRPEWAEVAALARLLGADLRAVYSEDDELVAVAEHPFAREIDPLRAHAERWRAMERGQLLEDFALAAATLRRQLDRIARASGVQLQFAVVPAGTGTPQAPADTVCVVGAGEVPDLPALAAGALLFMPGGRTHRRGDVVALARELDSLPVKIAEQIARNADCRVAVIDASGHADHVQHELGRHHERLIVAGAGMLASWEDAARLAQLRRVPVLALPAEGT